MKKIYIILLLLILSAFTTYYLLSRNIPNINVNILDQKYEEILNDMDLSTADCCDKILALSDTWKEKATTTYDELLKKLDKNGKKSLSDYWKSKKETEQAKMELYRILVEHKYEGGTIGAIELAKFEYQSMKQKALDMQDLLQYYQED